MNQSQQGKKGKLAEWFWRAGLTRITYRLPFKRRSSLYILAYHRVLDLGHEDQFPGDPELISATPADFAVQMAFIRKHWSPMTFGQFLDIQDRGRPLPPRPIVVTFDDGHRDNFTHAFPILRSLDIPASIFLTTSYIGRQSPFWFDRVATLLFYAPPGQYQIGEIGCRLLIADMASRRQATAYLLGRLKSLLNRDRLTVLATLESELSKYVPANTEYAQRGYALDWDQVGEMAAAGIEFGSHTVTHPILASLDDHEARRELTVSRRTIRTRTGQKCYVVAYPVGLPGTYSDRCIAAAQKAGYRLGVAYSNGTNRLSRLATFHLKRLAIERYVNQANFEAMLAFPKAFV